MSTLLLLLLAPLLAFVIAFFLATLLPRVCGYLLGPALLLSAAVFFIAFYDDIFVSGRQSDAWPGNFAPLILGYGGVVWCLIGVIFLSRGLAGVQAKENPSQTPRLERFSIPKSSRITPIQILLVAAAIEIVVLVVVAAF